MKNKIDFIVVINEMIRQNDYFYHNLGRALAVADEDFCEKFSNFFPEHWGKMLDKAKERKANETLK